MCRRIRTKYDSQGHRRLLKQATAIHHPADATSSQAPVVAPSSSSVKSSINEVHDSPSSEASTSSDSIYSQASQGTRDGLPDCISGYGDREGREPDSMTTTEVLAQSEFGFSEGNVFEHFDFGDFFSGCIVFLNDVWDLLRPRLPILSQWTFRILYYLCFYLAITIKVLLSWTLDPLSDIFARTDLKIHKNNDGISDTLALRLAPFTNSAGGDRVEDWVPATLILENLAAFDSNSVPRSADMGEIPSETSTASGSHPFHPPWGPHNMKLNWGSASASDSALSLTHGLAVRRSSSKHDTHNARPPARPANAPDEARRVIANIRDMPSAAQSSFFRLPAPPHPAAQPIQPTDPVGADAHLADPLVDPGPNLHPNLAHDPAVVMAHMPPLQGAMVNMAPGLQFPPGIGVLVPGNGFPAPGIPAPPGLHAIPQMPRKEVQSEPAFQPGHVLKDMNTNGEWVIKRVMGEGAYGRVYHAVAIWGRLGPDVAVKEYSKAALIHHCRDLSSVHNEVSLLAMITKLSDSKFLPEMECCFEDGRCVYVVMVRASFGLPLLCSNSPPHSDYNAATWAHGWRCQWKAATNAFTWLN
jgi:hypothetical protein